MKIIKTNKIKNKTDIILYFKELIKNIYKNNIQNKIEKEYMITY